MAWEAAVVTHSNNESQAVITIIPGLEAHGSGMRYKCGRELV